MTINQTVNMTGNIAVKDQNGNDANVASLVANNLDSNTQNLRIEINVYNKTLLIADGATNKAGETPAQQYTEFETAVKEKAKELGYAMFA